MTRTVFATAKMAKLNPWRKAEPLACYKVLHPSWEHPHPHTRVRAQAYYADADRYSWLFPYSVGAFVTAHILNFYAYFAGMNLAYQLVNEIMMILVTLFFTIVGLGYRRHQKREVYAKGENGEEHAGVSEQNV